jgi:hypothetical protein
MSTWDTTRNASGALGFTVGNITVTLNSGGGTDHASYGTGFNSAGKHVVKFTANTVNSTPEVGVGTSSASTAAGTYVGSDTNSVGWSASPGDWLLNNVVLAAIDTWQTGDVLYVAIDFPNKLIWGFNATRGSGLWNKTTTAANVDAGSGGVSISTISSMTLSPAANLKGLNEQLTLDPTAAGSPLTTFAPWDPTCHHSLSLLGVVCGIWAAKKIEENPVLLRRRLILPR